MSTHTKKTRYGFDPDLEGARRTRRPPASATALSPSALTRLFSSAAQQQLMQRQQHSDDTDEPEWSEEGGYEDDDEEEECFRGKAVPAPRWVLCTVNVGCSKGLHCPEGARACSCSIRGLWHRRLPAMKLTLAPPPPHMRRDPAHYKAMVYAR
jgi:hypothetical protein